MKTMRALLSLFVFAFVGIASAAQETFDPPITVALTFPDEPRAKQRVVGDLVSIDDAGAVLLVDGQRRRVAWSQVTPTSAFTARLRTIDQENADDWISLVTFGRGVGSERQAAWAAKRALRLDQGLAARVETALATPLGSLREAGIVAEEEPVEPAPANAAPRRELPPKFAPVDPADAAAAELRARLAAQAASQQLGVRLREIQTPRFLIFTDWEPVDDAWLSQQLEGAYALLCREFDVGPEQPVWIGRLPVYMFHDNATMMRHAVEIDGFAPHIEQGTHVAGYHASDGRGGNKLVMSKPVATGAVGLPRARQMWARTLTHEFVHAFLARYRGDRHLPRWLNEGLAEMLAETIMARPNAIATARQVAQRGEPISYVFDDAAVPGARMYPVMMTLTNGLYRQDPRKFVAMVDAIKAGQDPEEALQEYFGLNYVGLERLWRHYLTRGR
jgi:hypothetical protein